MRTVIITFEGSFWVRLVQRNFVCSRIIYFLVFYFLDVRCMLVGELSVGVAITREISYTNQGSYKLKIRTMKIRFSSFNFPPGMLHYLRTLTAERSVLYCINFSILVLQMKAVHFLSEQMVMKIRQ